MHISKKLCIQYILLIGMFILAMSMLCLFSSIYVHICTLIAAAIFPIILVKADVLHPFCWFPAFFCMYSISYPLLCTLGYPIYGYNKLIIIYQLLALYTCLFVVSPKTYNSSYTQCQINFTVKTGIFTQLIYIFALFLIIITSVYVASHSFSHKSQIYSNGGLLINAMFKIPLILSIFLPILVISYHKRTGKLPIYDILFGTIAISILTFLSGERDLGFRFIFILILLLYFMGYVKRRFFFLLIPIGIGILILSVVFKYYFLSGEYSSRVGEYGLTYTFLTSEFQSASSNLQYLVSFSFAEGIMGLKRLLADVVSLFDRNTPSLVGWYQNMFFQFKTTGMGFTLVGEGYLIGGWKGIILLFGLVGIIIKLFYKYAQRNIYLFSAYLYFIPLMIYSFRGDFSTILSGIVRQILITEIFIYILINLIYRKSKKAYEE